MELLRLRCLALFSGVFRHLLYSRKPKQHPESLSGDLVAFSNSQGGRIIIGVNDQGVIVGLSADDIRRINQLISNAATNLVHPSINPTTENIATAGRQLVMVVRVPSHTESSCIPVMPVVHVLPHGSREKPPLLSPEVVSSFRKTKCLPRCQAQAARFRQSAFLSQSLWP
jgi:hypothetical protein